MDMHRQTQILRGLPQRLVGAAVERLAARIGRQHRAAQTLELGDALDLVNPGLHVVGRDQGDSDQAVGIGAAELGQEIVIGAQAGVLQFEIVKQKQGPDSQVGVQRLRVDAVDIHVLEALDRIPAAFAGFFPVNLGRLVLFELMPGLDAHPQVARTSCRR